MATKNDSNARNLKNVNFIYLIVMLFMLLTSCKIIYVLKSANSQNITYTNQSCRFKLVNNQIILGTNFEDYISRDYILDLGSCASIIFYDTIPAQISEVNKWNLKRRIKSGHGEKIKSEYLKWGTINTDLFRIEDAFISSIQRPNALKCNNLSGIWGSDVFAQNIKGRHNKILLINLHDTTLSAMEVLPDLDDWQKIDADFSYLSYIKLNIKFGEIKSQFYLDTGFNGSIMMKRDVYNKVKDQENCSISGEKQIYGYINTTLSGIPVYDTAYTSICAFQISNGMHIDTVPVYSTSAIKQNLVGIDYLKRFNLLIDYQSKALYLQPNPAYLTEHSFFADKGFKAKNMEGDIILVVNITSDSPAEKAGLKVGDQILSINGIDSENIDNCLAVDLFNKIDSGSSQNVIRLKRGEIKISLVL